MPSDKRESFQADATPIVPGGADSALDLSDPRDRALLRQGALRWPERFRSITPAKRENWVNDLEDIRATAKNIADGTLTPIELKLAAVNTVRSCVATSAVLDQMQSRDQAEQLRDQQHLESLAQQSRLHGERIAAEAKRPPTQVLVVQFPGVPAGQPTETDIRAALVRAAPAALPPGPGAGVPEPKPGRQVRPARRKDKNRRA